MKNSSLLAGELRFDCEDFYYQEAQILDEGRLKDWLALLEDEIDYVIPIRVTKERSAGTGFSSDSFFFKEDYKSLKARIFRLESEYAWSEEIPSRTRRFVTNVRIVGNPGSGKDDDIRVRSNILLFRSQGNTGTYFLISGERHDVLHRAGNSFKIAKREVLLDHTVLPMPNFSVFL